MKKSGAFAVKLAVLWSVLAIFPTEALAIPAFARKYRTSCSTCHIAYPVLNSFGKAFKARGYRVPAEEKLTKDEPVSLGAPAWKQVFPESLWPADMPGGSVAAFWLSSRYRVNPSAAITNEFDGLHELYVLMGGTVGESLSFFGELEVIDGGTVPTAFSAALPRAFFQYNHTSQKFNMTFGLFEPRAVLTSTRIRLMRLSDYLSNRYGMPPTANAFSLAPHQRGIELWGNAEGPSNKGGVEWFFGVVNGSDARPGTTPAGAGAYGYGSFNTRFQTAMNAAGRTNQENNSNKDFYGGVNYKIGGMGVLGSGSEETLKEAENYVDNSATLGAFYYRGVAPTLVTRAGREALERDGNTFHRAGAKIDANIGKGNILAGIQLNRDKIREISRNFDELITQVEARYVLYPWLIPAVRFENLNPNFGKAFWRVTAHGSLMVRANIRLSIEGVLSRNSTTDPLKDFRRFEGGNDRQLHARLDFAF